MLHAIWFILAGIIIGFLARLLLPGKDPIGIVGTIILGIVGALIGGYLWEALFGPNAGVSWIGSVIVAMVLLFIYRKMTYGRTTTTGYR
jgi:uncharacterized membrane protein YeaQ/YmgE (transglycosylase-associated protein family)